jgi:hypothetical protein
MGLLDNIELVTYPTWAFTSTWIGQREGSVAIKITQPRAIQRRSYCEWRILDVCRTTDSLPVHFNFIRARDGSGGSRGFSEARTLFNSPLRLAAAAAPLFVSHQQTPHGLRD